MSATHKVEVLDKGERRVVIRMYIVHVDENSFCIEKNCALQILWDGAHADMSDSNPLNAEVSLNNILDARWLVAHADHFIERVHLLETANYPASPDLDFNDVPDKSALPQATIEIQVTDGKWLAHLQPGDRALRCHQLCVTTVSPVRPPASCNRRSALAITTDGVCNSPAWREPT